MLVSLVEHPTPPVSVTQALHCCLFSMDLYFWLVVSQTSPAGGELRILVIHSLASESVHNLHFLSSSQHFDGKLNHYMAELCTQTCNGLVF